MGAKKSQRNAAFVVFGIIAAGYFLNFVIFSFDGEGQIRAGGFGLVALGAIWIYLVGAPETLNCDRARNTCRLVSPRFLFNSKQVITFPLDRLRSARVNETYLSSHDGPGRTGYEVRLETDDGRAHVFTTTEDEPSAKAMVGRIRSFLKGEGGQTLLMRRFPWMMIALGGKLIVLGLLLVLSGAAGWSFLSGWAAANLFVV